MREKIVLFVVVLTLGAVAAHAQECKSGYSVTAGLQCGDAALSRPSAVPLPHRDRTVHSQAAGEIMCRGGWISWGDKGEPICDDGASSQKKYSPSLALKPLWRGLGWLLGL